MGKNGRDKVTVDSGPDVESKESSPGVFPSNLLLKSANLPCDANDEAIVAFFRSTNLLLQNSPSDICALLESVAERGGKRSRFVSTRPGV